MGWRSGAARALRAGRWPRAWRRRASPRSIARERGIDAPIIAAVAAILDGAITINEAVSALMSRPLRAEAE